MHLSSSFRHLATTVVFASVLAAGPGGLTRYLCAAPPAATQASSTSPARPQSLLDHIPFSFERNDGQLAGPLLYRARGAGYEVALGTGGAALTLRTQGDRRATSIGLDFVGGRPASSITGEEQLPGTLNYYRGSDHTRWRSGVATFARVRATAIYPGIDVVYYGHGRELEYDFLVSPGADPRRIELAFSGIDRLEVDEDGDLLLHVDGRIVRQHRPVAYQTIGAGERRPIAAAYCISGPRHAKIEVGDYERAQPLVIDPVLSYSSYFGGNDDDQVRAVEVDAAGNIYLTGVTESTVFPVLNAIQATKAGGISTTDAFVTKLDPSGRTVLFSTFLGGAGNENTASETIGSLALDANGNVFVAGDTTSADFPAIANAFQPTYAASLNNPSDGFIVKLTSTGELVYGSYIGGTDSDQVNAVEVTAGGEVVISGRTRSTQAEGFPLVNARDAVLGGGADAFVARISASGSALVYSTYIGGAGDEFSFYRSGMALDAQGNVFISGITTSLDYPTTVGVIRTARNNATNEGFVTKLSADGQTILASTFFGGSNGDNHVNDITLAPTGEVVMTGQTEATAGFPLVNAYQTQYQGGLQDGFVAKVSADLTAIAFSTYFGGNDRDEAYDADVDAQGVIHIVGVTRSPVFPLVEPVQATLGNPNTGGNDAFVAKLNPQGGVVFSSYLGSLQVNEAGFAVAATPTGETIAAGWTAGTNFPRVNPLQNVFQGGFTDGWVARIGRAADLGLTKAAAPGNPVPGQQVAFTLSVSNAGPEPASQITVTDTVPAGLEVLSCAANGGGVCSTAGNVVTVSFAALPLNNSATITIVTRVRPQTGIGVALVNTATAQSVTADSNPANNTATATVTTAGLDRGGDTDSDGIDNGFELDFGLDPLAPDASGDPDGDGRTNLEEFQQGTHPRGFVITYFAEGATGSFFDTNVLVANPGSTRALVLVRFQRDDGGVVRYYRVVEPHSRATIAVDGLQGMANTTFSSLIEADVPVVADRTMAWDESGYGGHSERGTLTRAATTWYLAEGATHGAFDLFYLIQNPGDLATDVEVTFLRPAPRPPIVRVYPIGAQTRFTVYVDAVPGLEQEEMSAVVRSLDNRPIVVERAMYVSRPGQTFTAGHNSAGVTAPALRWFLAEGATGSYFDLYVLIANPNPQVAVVDVEYLLTDGTIVPKRYEIAANSRYTISVDFEDPRLENAALSTIVTSVNNTPIVVERVMWWPSPQWHEGHNTPGETTTGTRWGLAEGELGGPNAKQTYILIANTSTFAGSARVTLLFENGETAERIVALPARSRVNVSVDATTFAAAVNRRFGTVVESLGATPAEIVVERALYWNANGVAWAAGTNALATKLQ
jgi:uncharacterized repeat protein (TIGR01451 family)